MKFTYVSKGGRVEMAGGGHPLINLTKVSGMGPPKKEYEESQYAGQSGTTTIASRDLPRMIILSGDLNGEQREIEKLLKTLYYPGELYCESGYVRRKIACKCINLEDIEKRNNCGINGFSVQFQTDNPYFSDFHDTSLSLSGYVNHVTNTFTLPCVFTERLQHGNCDNIGDIICYPVVTITARHSASEGIAKPYIKLKNVTTGATVIVNHIIQIDELVTIDLASRTVTSSIDGDITNHISDDTDLSMFYLAVGNNELVFENADTSQPLAATITYNNQYIMAVM